MSLLIGLIVCTLLWSLLLLVYLRINYGRNQRRDEDAARDARLMAERLQTLPVAPSDVMAWPHYARLPAEDYNAAYATAAESAAAMGKDWLPPRYPRVTAELVRRVKRLWSLRVQVGTDHPDRAAIETELAEHVNVNAAMIGDILRGVYDHLQ